ncbi:MAG TPA: response regulator [Hyphomicrobiaceae bacterium]|nr:response regulator [Hyphomicrobiaceae bacterium]
MRAHIAIVEDDDHLALMLHYNLTTRGFAITRFKDGIEALASLTSAPPDAVVLDWQLPRLSGIEVLRHLRATPATAELPILMLTGRTLPEERVRAIALRVEAFITKPFSVSDVLDRLMRALAGRGAQEPGPVMPSARREGGIGCG